MGGLLKPPPHSLGVSVPMINIAALVIGLLAAPAEAIKPGKYTLVGRILSDVGISLPIELKNFRRESPVAGSFDVHVSTSQIVQGIYRGQEFMFVIPFANVTTNYKFIFADKDVNGKYTGQVHISGEPKGDAHEGPFKVTLTRKAR